MIIEQHIGVCGSLMNARLAWVPPSPTSHETYTSVTLAQSPMLSSSFIDWEQRVHQILKTFEKKENHNYWQNFKVHQNYCSCCNYLQVSVGQSVNLRQCNGISVGWESPLWIYIAILKCHDKVLRWDNTLQYLCWCFVEGDPTFHHYDGESVSVGNLHLIRYSKQSQALLLLSENQTNKHQFHRCHHHVYSVMI